MDRSFLITRARLAKGLTQTQLVGMAGTSQATLSAYERGAKSPSLKVLWRILWVRGSTWCGAGTSTGPSTTRRGS